MDNNNELTRELANAIVRLHCFTALKAAKDFLSKEDQRVGDIRAEVIRSVGKLDLSVLAGFIETELKARIEREMITQEILPIVMQSIQRKYGINFTFTDSFMEYLKLKGYEAIQPLKE